MFSLKKPTHDQVPVWVNIFSIPLQHFNNVGLSLIASKLGKPLEIDSYTTTMCEHATGRVVYARILIEMSVKDPWDKDIKIKAFTNKDNPKKEEDVQFVHGSPEFDESSGSCTAFCDSNHSNKKVFFSDSPISCEASIGNVENIGKIYDEAATAYEFGDDIVSENDIEVSFDATYDPHTINETCEKFVYNHDMSEEFFAVKFVSPTMATPMSVKGHVISSKDPLPYVIAPSPSEGVVPANLIIHRSSPLMVDKDVLGKDSPACLEKEHTTISSSIGM
ncbi:unnamed protein product [Lactuca virosa]|uniref:DUF4283 domain-containing protein n=1 Tax=Lactuca virosa TaxID=75947 RepID=A0AAU9NMK2_9ASTR|nr:unnamed protein product [Lactuca virosa]